MNYSNFIKSFLGNSVAIKMLPLKSYIQALRNEMSKISLYVLQKKKYSLLINAKSLKYLHTSLVFIFYSVYASFGKYI